MIKSLVSTMIMIQLSLPVSAQDATSEDSSITSTATERELEADQDPSDEQRKEIIEDATHDTDHKLSVYGRVEVRDRHVEQDDSAWEDSGSRLGLDGYYEVASSSWLFARYELGFNLLDELGLDAQAYQSGQEFGKTLFTRLAYVGYQIDDNIVAYGKNWSTYYRVAGFTDRFDSMGGEASGAYNAFTDGGPSGTGRADRVLQTRLNFGTLQDINKQRALAINFQVQYGEAVPNTDISDYGVALGVSTVVEVRKNFSLGIAYNYAEVDLDEIPLMRRNGLNGSLSALLLGGRWYNENWYIGATVSISRNLQTTDNLIYFDGVGLELYGQYQVAPDIWALVGVNRLEPDSGQPQAGSYTLDYTVLGLRYSIKGFSRILYLESRIDRSRTYNNQKLGNQLAVGIRWGF